MPSLPQINYLGLLRTRHETAEGRYDSITRILAAAAVAGIAEGAVLAVINASTHGEKSPIRYFLMFVVVLLGFLWFKRYSLRRACALTESSICGLRTDVADKLRYCELRRFEQMSKTDILTRLSRDCTEILKSMPFIISGLASSVMLLFVAVYLTVLSRMAMAMVAVMLLLGVLVYLRRMKQVEGLLRRGVELEDRFFQVLKSMIDGFVQVKMDRGLGEDLHGNHLVPQAEETSDAKLTAQHTLNDLNLFAKTVYMCIVAAVVFLLPSLADLDEETTTKIVAAVLFLLAPVSETVAMMPFHAQCSVACANVNHLLERMDLPDAPEPDGPEVALLRKTGPFASIRLEGVAFSYQANGDEHRFRLGPLDLALERGELVYIVGGNGSGKSTLMKLLAGLYAPVEGRVLFNGARVTDANRWFYRQHFNAIFPDFHLFDRIYGKDVDPVRVAELLQTFELDQVTRYEDGRFTSTDLSTGQRKRLALAIALLDDRPICLFDEVAADQDPYFRRYYYEHVLPDLQQQGKTILAITHDDRWFSLADRVLKMEFGQFVQENDA